MNTSFFILLCLCLFKLLNGASTAKSKFIISTKRVPVTETDKESVTKERSEITLIEETKNFLSSNGYDLLNNETQNAIKYQKFETFKSFSENRAIKNTIKLVQLFTNLPTTGDLDGETIKRLHEPRCGVPDLRTQKFKILNDDQSESKFSAFKAVTSWSKKEMTWKLLRGTNDMPQRNIIEAINRAFQYWAEVAPITFSEVCSNCKADFTIDFGTQMHGDNFPFDGQGGVLAHAFFPENGAVHFDDAELFTEGSNRGTNLRIVAAHEIGHALGLDHSHTQGALMYPYYTYVEDPVNLLHQDDILGIQSLYGRRNKDPLPTSTAATRITKPSTTIRTIWTTTTRKTTKPTSKISTRSTSSRPLTTFRTMKPITTSRIISTTKSTKYVAPCEELNEAVFYGPNNMLYVLLDGMTLFSFDEKVKAWKNNGLIHNTFPKLELNTRGGVKCKKGYTWFFKNIRVWAYNGANLLPGYPKIITDLLYPFNPYTAVNKDGKIYVLKGNLAWHFDTESLRITGYPQRVTDIFSGIPNWIEAAIQYKEETVFFKSQYIYTYDKSRKTFIQRQKKDWPPCVSPRLI